MNHLDHLPGTFFGPSNIVDMLRHRTDCQPDETVFTYLTDGENKQVHFTYAELDRQARAIGAWLESRGLAGERALLLYPAGLEFIAAFYGCLYGGVVAVPVYPPRRNRSMDRIQAIADDAGAKVALTTDLVLSRVEKLIDETPNLKELTWLATCDVEEAIEENWEMPDVHGDTLAFLQYTSGSTGTPKGVMLSHANLIHNSALIAYTFEHSRSGIGVYWLPSYHDMGLIGGILQPVYMGRPNVFMSPMSFLQKPFRWLSALSRFGGTTSGGPNFAYDLCVRKITEQQRATLDLSRWEVAFNGAEPIRPETLDKFTEMFAPCGFRPEAFYPCYGLAESTLMVTGGYAFELPVIRSFKADALARGKVVNGAPGGEGMQELVGCGQNLPDQRLKIVDPETLTRCQPGTVGEIWASGPSIAQGYWRQEEATKSTFRAELSDTGEGLFLRTGDLGFLHDGELFYAGRIKDLIIVHGVNHYPQDIELTAQRAHHRLRRDCGGAFTVEVDGKEKLVIAQEVERRKKKNFDPIFDAVRCAVATQHDLHLDAIVLLKAGSIPKTSSGKVQRHACRNGYLDCTLAVVGQWEAYEVEEALPPETAETETSQEIKKTIPRAESDARRQEILPGIEKKATKPLESKRAAADSTGRQGGADRQRTTELVVKEIRRVAKGRAEGMTLDSPIVETGLDSLERMEILASLEELFGGRFPEDILPDLETARQLVDAVEKFLGGEPRLRTGIPADVEIPEANYQVAQFPEYVELRKSLDLLRMSGVRNPFFTAHEAVTNEHAMIDGRKVLNFSSYNYTSMSGNPKVAEAAKAAIDKYGTSTSASRLVAGEKDLHVELEHEIAEFLGTEDAMAMVGGHSTNETIIGHLMGPGDLILHDSLSHNSIVQGCILSGARRRPFKHNDPQAADELLRQFRHEYRRVLLVIEGVYSMDGDIADLPKFIEIKKKHRAMLMVDEAHSVGVLGPNGQGIGAYFDGIDRADVDIWMGTFSKSFGSVGGHIAGCKELIEYLKYTTPGFVFAASIPPAAAAAALTSIRIWKAEPERFIRLLKNARLFLALAKERGMNTGLAMGTAIVPIILGNSLHCLQLSEAMLARGINVMPILHPAVEESAARLRFFITALHTEEQIRHTIDVMAEELEKIDPDHLTPEPSDGTDAG